MTTTMGFSQNGVLVNELYKKESFKYSFLKYKDNRYTLEEAQNGFFQMEQNNIDDREEDLDVIDSMLF